MRSVVRDAKALAERIQEVHARYRQPVLVEEFIAGRELYVSLLGNGDSLAALPMHEVDFSHMPAAAPHIVTYDGKWDPASQEYKGTCSKRAELSDAQERRVAEVARAAFLALELSDYARVDVRLAANGVPYVIDVNPNCDLSDGAGVCRAASFGGIAYPDLIERVIDAALIRYEKESNHGHEHRSHRNRRRDGAEGDARKDRGAPADAARSRAAESPPQREPDVHARGDLGRARTRRRRAR
jgi:D-alanine-D-alanine ligase